MTKAMFTHVISSLKPIKPDDWDVIRKISVFSLNHCYLAGLHSMENVVWEYGEFFKPNSIVLWVQVPLLLMLIVHYLELKDSRVEEARGEVKRGQCKWMCVKGHGGKMQRKCLRPTPRTLLLSYITIRWSLRFNTPPPIQWIQGATFIRSKA